LGGASGKDTSLSTVGAVLGPGSVTAPGVQASVPSNTRIRHFFWRYHTPPSHARQSLEIIAISALRRAFNYGYLDYPERVDPAASLKCARIGKKSKAIYGGKGGTRRWARSIGYWNP